MRQALVVPAKPKWGAKDFPFKGFIKCYSCGSSPVGEHKLRKRRDGSVREYTYCHCSRQVDRDCRELFAREEDIIEQLHEMRHQLIPDKSVIEPSLKNAIQKASDMSGVSLDEAFDMYTKYVLYKGTKFEQTRFVSNINANLRLRNRNIILLAQLLDQVKQ